jgi:hypothetical protein
MSYGLWASFSSFGNPANPLQPGCKDVVLCVSALLFGKVNGHQAIPHEFLSMITALATALVYGAV